jgi:hypothetical protein
MKRFLELLSRYQANHYGMFDKEILYTEFKKLSVEDRDSITFKKKFNKLWRGMEEKGFAQDNFAASFTNSKSLAEFFGYFAAPFKEVKSYEGAICTKKVGEYIRKHKIKLEDEAEICDDEGEVIIFGLKWK